MNDTEKRTTLPPDLYKRSKEEVLSEPLLDFIINMCGCYDIPRKEDMKDDESIPKSDWPFVFVQRYFNRDITNMRYRERFRNSIELIETLDNLDIDVNKFWRRLARY